MQKIKVKETEAIATRIVLPNDTNSLSKLYGGTLLGWMDQASVIAAHRLCKRVVVTASVNHVSFNRSINLGEIVTVKAKVSRSFGSSMEVYMDVYVEDSKSKELNKCNEAIYTLVAVDQLGNPINVPQVIPETEEEKERFEGALRRRQLSLVLAGKLKVDEAVELKKLFES